MSIVIVISLCLRVYFVSENKRRDRMYGTSTGTPASEPGKNVEGEKTLDTDSTGVPVMYDSCTYSSIEVRLCADYGFRRLERRFDSDRQNKSFRYSY